MQGIPAGNNEGNNQSSHQNQQSSIWADAEEPLDIGIDGFSYGEVRRVDRPREDNDGNRQSADQGARQGGGEI
jgi:hypothetical protein